MNGFGLQPGGFRQAFRRPAGRGAEKAFHLLGSQDLQNRVHQRRLADAGAAGDDGGAAGQNGLQRLPLAWRQRLAGTSFAPFDGLFEIDRRIGRTGRGQTPDPGRNSLLRSSQVGQEDQKLAIDFFENQKAAGQHLRERPLDDILRHLQQLHGRGLEFIERQGAMSLRGRPQQNVIDAGTRPVLRVFWDPDALSDLIGRGEADAVDLLRQRVRVLPHRLNGQISVGLEDADRPPGADSVTMQEKHDLTDLHALLPGIGDPLPALWPDPVDGLEIGGVVANHL